MTTAKHTALPWVTRPVPKQGIICIAQDGKMHPHAFCQPAEFGKPLTDEDYANAELIVKACNEHAKLRAMLSEVRQQYGRLHDMLSDCVESGRINEDDLPDDYQAIADQLETCVGVDHRIGVLLGEDAPVPPDPRDEAYRQAARTRYADPSDDDIEVHDNAVVSKGENGAFVQAWVYVRNADIDS